MGLGQRQVFRLAKAYAGRARRRWFLGSADGRAIAPTPPIYAMWPLASSGSATRTLARPWRQRSLRSFMTFTLPAKRNGCGRRVYGRIAALGLGCSSTAVPPRSFRQADSIDTVIRLPVSYPTCVCLGGPDLDTLFVTSARFPVAAQQRSSEPLAGGLFTLRVPVQGLVEPTFEPDL